jgi:CheY-like chemotaxis protein
MIRQSPAVHDIPLILLTSTRALPPPALRRHFRTSVTPDSDDTEWQTAFRIAGSRPIATPKVIQLSAKRETDIARRSHAAPQAHRQRVLLVDDCATNQRVLTAMLENANYACEIAHNGLDALDKIADQDFDVMLTDLNMPEMDGFQTALATALVTAGGPGVPVIGITADRGDEIKQRASEAGMHACLSKPISQDELIMTIDKVVATHKLEQRAARTRNNVTSLAEHPLFQLSETAVVDAELLTSLAAPRGDGFLKDTHRRFLSDTTSLMTLLRDAAQRGSKKDYEVHLRNLRSTAATIGAQRLSNVATRGMNSISVKSQSEVFALLDQLDQEILTVSNNLASLWSKAQV